jgi:hypothetical protein
MLSVRTAGAVLVTVGLLWAAGGVSAAELLTNGSLDATYQQEIVPGFSLPKPANWVNVGTRAISGAYEDEMSSETWAGPAPTPVTTNDNGVFFKGFSGTATTGAATAHLYQDNPASPGVRYTLTGWAGAEANFMGAGQLAVEFLDAGGTEIPLSGSELDLNTAGLFTPNGQPFNYKQYTVSAVAPAGAAMVRARVSMLNGLNNPAGGGQAFVVDDFSLVPEPTALALVLPATLALLRRRRR